MDIKKSMVVFPSLSDCSGTEALAGHLPQLYVSLVPSHTQRLLLEAPQADRLDIQHPRAPIQERFVENRAGGERNACAPHTHPTQAQ